MKIPKIIGISGNATCGKDTFAKYLKPLLEQHGKEVVICSIAKAIRLELDDLLKSTLNISAFTTDPIEKEKIRPVLAFWGMNFRRRDNPNVWIEKLVDTFESDKIYIITDVRFDNEIAFIRNFSTDTYFIHLERVQKNTLIVPPANEYEAQNEFMLKRAADATPMWFTFDDEEDYVEFVSRFYSAAFVHD